MNRSFIVLHGLGGSGPEHWQSWLYKELLDAGENVYYPTLPDYDDPHKDEWIQTLEDTFHTISSDHITVVAHSLGCILWLQFALKNNQMIKNRVKRVMLVAPPSPYLEHEIIQRFFPLPVKGKEAIQSYEHTLQIQSTNDPYCSVEDSQYFKNLGIKQLLVVNKGHINIDSGFGEWPWILDYCMDRNVEFALKEG